MLWTQGKKMHNKETEMHARISRSIEEVSRIYREEANLNGSRICQGFIGQTESFLMDREAIELVLLGNKKHTNSSINSTKVKTLMYFLRDY